MGKLVPHYLLQINPFNVLKVLWFVGSDPPSFLVPVTKELRYGSGLVVVGLSSKDGPIWAFPSRFSPFSDASWSWFFLDRFVSG